MIVEGRNTNGQFSKGNTGGGRLGTGDDKTTKKLSPIEPISNAPKLKLDGDGNGTAAGKTTDEINTNVLTFLKACGTKDADLMTVLINQLSAVLPASIANATRETCINGALAMLSGIKPKNEIEGMLAAQMVTTHILSMETAKRAMLADQTVMGVTENVNRCNKLMRTFTLQVEALSKLRGDSKTVTVKHVTVASGGQAIIGDVHHRNTNDKN
ncbi:MAG: hypothetical protein HOH69_06960 [Gammaproteobacteria bacterium]|nr:hypothetical protein [Gammaproteobacteria bacterium]